MDNKLYWPKSLNPQAYASSFVKWKDLTKWPLSKAFGSNANSKVSWVWKLEMRKSNFVILPEETQHEVKISW